MCCELFVVLLVVVDLVSRLSLFGFVCWESMFVMRCIDGSGPLGGHRSVCVGRCPDRRTDLPVRCRIDRDVYTLDTVTRPLP
ncbi:hypothetical protein FKM82_026809 [Ascaphus truei]